VGFTRRVQNSTPSARTGHGPRGTASRPVVVGGGLTQRRVIDHGTVHSAGCRC
jgi:hypothetical protein